MRVGERGVGVIGCAGTPAILHPCKIAAAKNFALALRATRNCLSPRFTNDAHSPLSHAPNKHRQPQQKIAKREPAAPFGNCITSAAHHRRPKRMPKVAFGDTNTPAARLGFFSVSHTLKKNAFPRIPTQKSSAHAARVSQRYVAGRRSCDVAGGEATASASAPTPARRSTIQDMTNAAAFWRRDE